MCMDFLRAIYDTKLPLPKASYPDILQDLEHFSVSSQVYILLKQQGRLEETPLFFQERLKESHNTVLYKNLFIKNQNEKLLNEFEKKGIDVIPLKGVIFSEKYFGHIGTRPTSDIDILVRRADVERAIECVKALGYTDGEEHISDHFHLGFCKNIPGSPNPLAVEIHWDILIENTANLSIDEFWRDAVPEKMHIKQLSNYHTFYMICLHGWRHNLDSPKYYLDIVQLLHLFHEEMDYERLFQDAASHKTFKRMLRTLALVYQEFPHLKALKELPYKRKLLRGKFKKNNNNSFQIYKDFIDYQFLSYDDPKHSLLEFMKWLKPSSTNLALELSYGERQSRYKYLILNKRRIFKGVKKFFTKV